MGEERAFPPRHPGYCSLLLGLREDSKNFDSGKPVQGGTLGTLTRAFPSSLLLDEQNIPEDCLGAQEGVP